MKLSNVIGKEFTNDLIAYTHKGQKWFTSIRELLDYLLFVYKDETIIATILDNNKWKTKDGITIDEELKNTALRISHKDGELTPNDILSLIETLIEIGADKNIILKCDNVAELKAIGIYYNVLNNK